MRAFSKALLRRLKARFKAHLKALWLYCMEKAL